MPFTGPLFVNLVQPVVPKLITPATDFTTTIGANKISGFISGPYDYQASIDIGVFGGTYAPAPAPIVPCPEPIPAIPAAADPPFPPTYPYLFSSDTVYGRDNVGVIQTIVRQDTYAFDVVATQTSNGTALDLTGCTLVMTARFQENATAAVFTLSSTAGDIVITGALTGAFTVTIPSSATLTVPLVRTELFYDIQYSLAAVRRTLTRGILTVLPDTTTS